MEFFGSLTSDFFALAGRFYWLWLTIPLLLFAWFLWIRYIRTEYISKIDWVLLELVIPREVSKSPQAMEIFFTTALYQSGGVGTWYQRYWLGNVPAWFSLEIVSIEGKVRFFIRTERKFKRLIESQMYAQYPNVEIFEREDYAYAVPPHDKNGEWSMIGTEFTLTKNDAYPIKTYVDYGLDRATGSLEEEEKIDPITPMIEFFGSLKEGEQLWFQILVRPSNWERFDKDKKDSTKDGYLAKQKWQKETERLKNELLSKGVRKIGEGEAARSEFKLTKGEENIINALERAADKPGFDTGMRILYITAKDKFDPSVIPALTSVLRQYNSEALNGFKPSNFTAFDYPWQDFSGKGASLKKTIMLELYKQRAYFYHPAHRTPFVLTTEELATIFHIPGRVAATPTVDRIESQKSAPPANLPI